MSAASSYIGKELVDFFLSFGPAYTSPIMLKISIAGVIAVGLSMQQLYATYDKYLTSEVTLQSL